MTTKTTAPVIDTQATPTRRIRPCKAPVLQLVRPATRPAPKNPYEAEMIAGLSQFVALATTGELTGMAYVATGPGDRVTVGTFGATKDQPYLTTHWLDKLKLILLRKQ